MSDANVHVLVRVLMWVLRLCAACRESRMGSGQWWD